MKHGHKRIESPPMVPRKAAVVASMNDGDPCVMVYIDGGRDVYTPMQARQLAKDLNEALEALAGD